MIIGTGIDIVEINRIKKVQERSGKFVERILTAREQEIFNGLSGGRKHEFLAGRFAAKEAYAKAVGTGIGEGLNFVDIEVLPDEKGKPVIISPRDYKTHLSISHSEQYAVAQVIIESLSS